MTDRSLMRNKNANMLTLNVYHVLDLLGCGGRTRY